jgi:NTP pyrophosphatase (non-canonical NTP hydrolase)
MTFEEYQKQAMTTAIYKDDFVKSLLYRTLGMVGEAGEVAEKVKKIIRDNDCVITEAAKMELIKEMGDVLWYLQALSDHLGVPFEDVARTNLAKLASRQQRNILKGSGDNR